MYVLRLTDVGEVQRTLGALKNYDIFLSTIFYQKERDDDRCGDGVRFTLGIHDVKHGKFLIDCKWCSRNLNEDSRKAVSAKLDEMRSFCVGSKLHFQPGFLEA